MFAATPQIVSRDHHAHKVWLRPTGYRFAASVQFVQIAASEISHCARLFPLAFMRQGDGHVLAAILGSVAGQNLFVASDGRWIGTYVPALIRSYPFRLVRTSDDKLLLGFDETSGLIQEAAGQEGATRFYDDEGRPAETTRKLVEFLVLTTQSIETVSRAVRLLAELDLLEPWAVGGERAPAAGGISRLNEGRLRSLDGEQLVRLRNAGALAIAYAQLLSMGNLETLQKLEQVHASHMKEAASQASALSSSLFSDSQGDLAIDWDEVLGGGAVRE